MATNVIPSSEFPYYWSSANDNIIYGFNFKQYVIDSAATNSGNVRITLMFDFDVTPQVGDQIFIDGSIYTGTHTVISVTGTSSVTLNTPYIGTITSNVYNLLHLRTPVFSLYKGFKPGEQFDNVLFYTKVVDIKPTVIYKSNYPSFQINIKGAAKYLFNIESNTIIDSIDFSMFNAVRLIYDGISTVSSSNNDWTLVLNCAISNEELIYEYIAYGKYLTPLYKPLVPTSGPCILSAIDGTNSQLPYIFKFIDGIRQ